jgi:hypothetical protein
MHGRTNEINNLQTLKKTGKMPSSEAEESQVGDTRIIQVQGCCQGGDLGEIIVRIIKGAK